MDDSEKLQDRFVLDYEDIQREMNLILDQVRELRNDSFIKRILSKEDREEIMKWESLVKEKMEEEFSVVVVGDFKRGKSTLINALLGKDVVTTNVTPETVTINRISYGEEPKMEAVLKNGKRLRLNKDELSRAELEKIIAELPEPIDYIDMKENNELLKEISIVDTPGVGDLMKAFDQKVMDYIIKADAVFYVVSALSPISETELMFLNTAVLPHSFSRIFLLINMIDCIDEKEDMERIKAAVTEKVKAAANNLSVFAISGLDEYCRKNDLKRPNKELADYFEANYLEFETAIKNDIILQKMVIKSERVLQIVKLMVNDIESRIKLIGNMLTNSKEELLQLEEKYEQQNLEVSHLIKKNNDILQSEINKYCVEAKDWMTDFLSRVKQELEKMRQGQTTEILQKHLQFYLTDTIKEAMLMCVRVHKDKIEERLNEIAKSYSNDLNNIQVSVNKLDVNFLLTDISWTGVDTATFFINQGLTLAGMGGMSIIGNAIAGYARQSRMSKKQENLIEPILNNFNRVTEEVYASIDKAYETMEKDAIERLAAGYKNQLEKSLGAVRQAKEVSATENIKSEEVKEQIENAMEILETIHKSLDRF